MKKKDLLKSLSTLHLELMHLKERVAHLERLAMSSQGLGENSTEKWSGRVEL